MYRTICVLLPHSLARRSSPERWRRHAGDDPDPLGLGQNRFDVTEDEKGHTSVRPM
jgi:hypothetical protein